MKRVAIFLLTFLLLFTSVFPIGITNADQLDDITAQINTLTQQLNDSVNATRPLQSQLTDMQQQISQIQAQVAQIDADVATKKKQISDGYAQITKEEQILQATIRDLYIRSSYNSPLLTFLSGTSASEVTRVLAYQQAVANEDKATITNVALSVINLQQEQQSLQDEESRLAVVKANLDTQSQKLNTIIQGALAYQSSLSNQIAALSAQQQQLLAQKYGTLGIPTTAYTSSSGCSSDISPYKDPGFSGTKFGFFTYGVYHRVGMSQYGAKGRADAGQGYAQILSFYYPNTQLVNIGTSTTIVVNGTNDYGETFSNQSFNIEDYLTHIYEMPSSWNMQALEAQAIAARTYAYQAVQSGRNPVAPNQSFQEVKTEQNASSWIAAVQATSGQVLESGGQPITAWFSSTGGGYTHNSGDVFGSSTNYTTTAADANGGISSFTDLQNNAYDGPNYANSPWFYCDWGGRAQYNNTAWLQSSEVADIVNVILLAQKDPSTASHLSQPDGNVPDTWSPSQVAQQLQNDGVTPFTSISNVSVSADFGAGKITTVTVTGDAGTQSFSGDTFVTYFDVRAPGNIFIPFLRKNSDGSYAAPLFNVEMR